MAQTTGRISSGSTNGRGVIIQSTNGASGTLLHTVTATGTPVTQFDEIYIHAMNLTTVVRKLGINFGGLTSGDKIRVSLPLASAGLMAVIPGLRLNAGVVVRGFTSGGAGVVSCYLRVNRTV
jgi:hypothetical protein